MHMACLFGYKFSIVTILERARPVFEELVRRVGLESKCASIRTTTLRVLDIEKDPSITLRILTEAGRAAIIEDGAEVICLGCAGMTGLDKPMEKALGVPVLDGVVCAIKFAEAAYDYKLKHSKVKAYMKPEPKEYVGLVEFAIT
jgi:allantoin racemase